MNMTIAFGCTSVSLALVTWILVSGRLENGGLLTVFCVKIFIAPTFIVVYLYLLECYPTTCRATGLAFCMVIGRLGAFMCPFLYDGLFYFTDAYQYFFLCIAVVIAAAAILVLF